MMRIGVDVGGTFTDLIGWDGRELHIVKIPSTPPDYQNAVIDAVHRVTHGDVARQIVHGSTVATNALLQRRGEPVAFITTEGFRDMLLIGRQNRPRLYALHPRRPSPIVAEEHCFTVHERIAAEGSIVDPLDDAEIARVINQIQRAGIHNVAVCLLFSFVNPIHEQMIARSCANAGLAVTLSSKILPEFREYERASTTAITAALRPIVSAYLAALSAGLKRDTDLRIMHSAGGTLSVDQASAHAASLVLSGPAGGVIGAAYVAQLAGVRNVITYDMGGTSTDVAIAVDGQPRWTALNTIDGLPVALPMFDIHTIGAGGGSIAALDAGGALRVGPQSAGAMPGPACYGRGGTLPTVTDANLVLGRIPRDALLAGQLMLDHDAANAAIEPLARGMNLSVIEAANGIVRVAESNMAQAVRAVTSRRGFDPRDFALVSFGGAGGLHACAIADQLDISRVIIPPCCGVLSALGMIVAPPVADVSQTVLQIDGQLDDQRLAAEFANLSRRAEQLIPADQTELLERSADVRFAGQSHEVNVELKEPTRAAIRHAFLEEYARLFGQVHAQRREQIVSLRLRRVGRASPITLPPIRPEPWTARRTIVHDSAHSAREVPIFNRGSLLQCGDHAGPFVLLEHDATAFVPAGWRAHTHANGSVEIQKES